MKNRNIRKKATPKRKTYMSPEILKTYSEEDLAKETKAFAQDIASDAWEREM